MRGLTTSCVDCRLFAMVVVAYVITLKGMVKQWFMTTVDIGLAAVLIGIFQGVGHQLVSIIVTVCLLQSQPKKYLGVTVFSHNIHKNEAI